MKKLILLLLLVIVTSSCVDVNKEPEDINNIKHSIVKECQSINPTPMTIVTDGVYDYVFTNIDGEVTLIKQYDSHNMFITLPWQVAVVMLVVSALIGMVVYKLIND